MGLSLTFSRDIPDVSSASDKNITKPDDLEYLVTHFTHLWDVAMRRCELRYAYGVYIASAKTAVGKPYETVPDSCFRCCLCCLGNHLDLLCGTRRHLLTGALFYQQKSAKNPPEQRQTGFSDVFHCAPILSIRRTTTSRSGLIHIRH